MKKAKLEADKGGKKGAIDFFVAIENRIFEAFPPKWFDFGVILVET